MKNNKFITASIFITAVIASSSLRANENLIYFGGGSAKDSSSSTTTDKSPMSFGYLRSTNGTDNVFGIDIGREGSMLDSTWGKTKAVKQATSYNFLAGRKLGNTENSRFDGAFILGVREKTSDCPSSYLGYQCYANTNPDTKYGFNYGVALFWNFKSAMLGIRATGESTQAILGVRF